MRQLKVSLRSRKLPYATLSPQCRKLVDHLRDKGSISGMEAWAVYRIRALPRRVADLKAVGYVFLTEWKRDPTGQRYVRYTLLN